MKRFSFLLYFFVTFSWGQQTDVVDFKHCSADLHFDASQKKVFGEIDYTFEILKDVDSVFLDAVDMRFERIRLIPKNKKSDLLYHSKVPNGNDGKKLWLIHDFKKGQEYSLRAFFVGKPQKALYFIDWGNELFTERSRSEMEEGVGADSISATLNARNEQIWTQGQGKYTSNWLPSIDDMNDKIEFDLSITFDKGYEVISNGKLKKKLEPEYFTTWIYDMENPMSSYLVALAIGKYHKKVEYSKSGIPLEMYYYPEDSLKVEPTYRYTKQMFDFLEVEIGVPYPWQNYKQVPVKDFLYAGMENTSCTIFSDAFMVDSIAFIDKNYVNVNAHELAHQWFGNLVTETSGTHHWLQEGFATYYALLAERDVFGDDYYYWRLYEYAQELIEQDKTGGSTSLLDPKSSSTTFYKKGAWVLHLLREQVGDEAFRTAVKNYLLENQFKNVETDDFISEVEKESGQDLSEFVQNYFNDIEFFTKFLMKKTMAMSIRNKMKRVTLACKTRFDQSRADVDWTNHFPRKIDDISRVMAFRGLYKDSTLNRNNLLKFFLMSDDLKVRQEIAKTLTEIPLELKPNYETLLKDKSYITIEAALFNLWKNFPQERTKYLNQTKDIIGFNDKNVRILWLTLALLTENFAPENKAKYLEELTGYSSPKYGFETRINAFRYLTQIQACNENCKENLKQATTHHNWQMVKFAKVLQSQMEQ